MPCPAPPCPAGSGAAWRRWAEFAVISLGQDLIAEKEDQVAAAAEIGVQHAGFAGGELGHVAGQHTLVAGQVAIHDRAFRGHFGLHQRVGRGQPRASAPRPGNRPRRGTSCSPAARRCTARGSSAAPARPGNGDCRRPAHRRRRELRWHGRPPHRNDRKTPPRPWPAGPRFTCFCSMRRPSTSSSTGLTAVGLVGRSSSVRPPVARGGRRSMAGPARGVR